MNIKSEELFLREESRYKQLLEDDRWKEIRIQILKRDGSKCVNCSAKTNLQVHHKQYHVCNTTGTWNAPWEYHTKYLVTLCVRCHKAGHAKFKIPVFGIKKSTANRLQWHNLILH